MDELQSRITPIMSKTDYADIENESLSYNR
jgi:hypothetical protein